MSNSIKEERLRWVLSIYNKQIKLVNVALVCPYSERSLKRWIKAYCLRGDKALEPKSTRPKTQPNETPIHIKEQVIWYRKKHKVCA